MFSLLYSTNKNAENKIDGRVHVVLDEAKACRSPLCACVRHGLFRHLKSQPSHAHAPPASPTGRGDKVVEAVVDDDAVREVQSLERGELVPRGGRRAEDELPPSSPPLRAPAALPSSCASPMAVTNLSQLPTAARFLAAGRAAAVLPTSVGAWTP